LVTGLDGGLTSGQTGRLTEGRKITLTLTLTLVDFNPVPGDITGPLCSGGHKYGDLALQVGGVSYETVKYGRVLRDLDPTVTALVRPRSNCTTKLQTYPLVREGAPHQETRNFQTETKTLVMGSRWEPDTRID
jgi:hypothetical protein